MKTFLALNIAAIVCVLLIEIIAPELLVFVRQDLFTTHSDNLVILNAPPQSLLDQTNFIKFNSNIMNSFRTKFAATKEGADLLIAMGIDDSNAPIEESIRKISLTIGSTVDPVV
jgi:hypothetical protein